MAEAEKQQQQETTTQETKPRDGTNVVYKRLERKVSNLNWQRTKSMGSVKDLELSPDAENEFKAKLQKARQRVGDSKDGPVSPQLIPLKEENGVDIKKVERVEIKKEERVEIKKAEPKEEEIKSQPVPKPEPKMESTTPKSPVTSGSGGDKKKIQYGMQFQGFQASPTAIQTKAFGIVKSTPPPTNTKNKTWERTSTIADFRIESIQKKESLFKKRDSFVGSAGTAFQGVITVGDPVAGLEAKRKLRESISAKKALNPVVVEVKKEENELAKKFAEKQKVGVSTVTTDTPPKLEEKVVAKPVANYRRF